MSEDQPPTAPAAAAAEPPSGTKGAQSSPRSRRRATTKKVNYAKEQEFSDEDIFEDSPDEDAPYRSRKPRGGGGGGGGSRRAKASGASSSRRTSNVVHVDDTGGGSHGAEDTRRAYYTEPGYDSSLPPIRERFPFLPEYEEDGTPKIDLIVGRRPVDEKEDIDPEAPENGADVDVVDEDESLTKRSSTTGTVKRKGRGRRSFPLKMDPAKDAPSGATEFEYLVKYRGRSYLHLEWKRGADLESMNKSAKGIYRRYLKKVALGAEEDSENPEFDPAYAVPQKILDEQEQEITVELTDKELLKWEKQRDKELAMAAEEEEGDLGDDATGLGEEATTDAVAVGAIATGQPPEEENKGKDIWSGHRYQIVFFDTWLF